MKTTKIFKKKQEIFEKHSDYLFEWSINLRETETKKKHKKNKSNALSVIRKIKDENKIIPSRNNGMKKKK